MTEGRSYHDYRTWIFEEWSQRKQKNPAYSLRALSRSFGVSPTTLSQVLSGRRPLSRKAALKIVHQTAMPSDGAKSFLASALGLIPSETATTPTSSDEYDPLDPQSFELIADWTYFAILGLANLAKNEASPAWIAGRLGIPLIQAKVAFDRLVRLGLVKLRGKGFYQSRKPISVPTQRASAIFRRYHASVLEKALSTLEDESAEVELFSSTTMAVDPIKLPQVRTLIQDFRRKVAALLESGAHKEVYTLAIQAFPMEKKK